MLRRVRPRTGLEPPSPAPPRLPAGSTPLLLVACWLLAAALPSSPGPAVAADAPPQDDGLAIFISIDMEGLSGVGTPAMTGSGGKDYGVGRRMMTAELEAVVRAIRGAARDRGIDDVEIVGHDPHGDHQNVLVEELPLGVTYIQGSIKPLGMMAGFDEGFDAVIFLGYHARAGTEGFLAHTGSGLVRHLAIDGVPSGEGELNGALAGSRGVPVVLVAGDAAYVDQARETYAASAETVVTKTHVTGQAARLRPVEEVRAELIEKARAAVADLSSREPWVLEAPYTVAIDSVTHVDIARHLPGVERTGPYSVRFELDDMADAYRLVRILYRFLSV